MTPTNFRVSFCDPFKKDIVQMGYMEKDQIMQLFETIPWQEYLVKMDTAKESEFFYSPSLEIENMVNYNGLSISGVDDNEWYVFFKRPKRVKKFFGLVERRNNNYLTEVHGQTKNDARRCLEALLRNDLSFLENKVR